MIRRLMPLTAHLTQPQVVLAPVVLGAALNQRFPQTVRRSAPFSPLVGSWAQAAAASSQLRRCVPPERDPLRG